VTHLSFFDHLSTRYSFIQFKVIGKPMNLNVCAVIGGKDMVFQGKDLADRPHIVVATPGRFVLSVFIKRSDRGARSISFLIYTMSDQ
jgi:ATP-dependent RNA helicase DDX49/DBP8